MNNSKVGLATLVGAAAMTLAALVGCGPDASSPPVPSVEWNQQKYGQPPEKRPLSAVEITTEQSWVVAREKDCACGDRFVGGTENHLHGSRGHRRHGLRGLPASGRR